MKNSILVVAAHPDDEILGCGGTIARLVGEGHEAYTLILGEGMTSRDNKRDRKKMAKELAELKEHIYIANAIIGVKEVYIHDLPDNRFDTVPLLDIVKMIEEVKKEVAPDIIFTHYGKDLNIDHHITYRAVITAARPLRDEHVKEIYSFEVLSSTEWNYPMSFAPDCFYDISDTIKLKLEAMSAYKTELHEFPHPRSLKGITVNAEQWGMKNGLMFAEAFKSMRVIR